MDRLTNVMALLRRQLWLLPALISLIGLVLAGLMLGADHRWVDLEASRFWWLYRGDASSAASLLGTFLSGMMTMTSLVVSLTFVTLTLAANQLGPRLILSFIGDRQIQAVLGLFLGTILYLTVVLRSIDGTRGDAGVPALSIGMGSLLTVACLFALLFYVHKIARSTIADTVIERVSGELQRAVRARLLPASPEASEPWPRPRLPDCQARVAIGQLGYLQMVDYPAVVRWARERDALVDVRVRAGHFLFLQGDHLLVRGGEKVDEEALDRLRAAFIVGDERSPAQDLEYSIRQMVEIALRALSPGINDPNTAIAVIDRLGGALEAMLARRLEPEALFDEDGQLRVLAARSDFQGLVDACFDQIRQAGVSHPAVLIRIADVVGKLAPGCTQPVARAVLLTHLDRLAAIAGQSGPGEADHEAVIQRIEQARRGYGPGAQTVADAST